MEFGRRILLPEFLRPLVKDGLSEGCNILLLGPPGNGKTIFCDNFAKQYLEDNKCSVYVTSEKTPGEITYNFRQLGIDLKGDEFRDNLIFVDGYTWLTGKSDKRFKIESLSNLTELNYKISSAISTLSRPVLLIFNSLSPLTLYNSEAFVLKFLQLLFAKIKECGAVGIFIAQSGVHNQTFYTTMEYLVDGIFDMKMEEDQGNLTRFFRIRSLNSVHRDTRWVPFSIDSDRQIKLAYGGIQQIA